MMSSMDRGTTGSGAQSTTTNVGEIPYDMLVQARMLLKLSITITYYYDTLPRTNMETPIVPF